MVHGEPVAAAFLEQKPVGSAVSLEGMRSSKSKASCEQTLGYRGEQLRGQTDVFKFCKVIRSEVNVLGEQCEMAVESKPGLFLIKY